MKTALNFIPQETLDHYCSVSSAHYLPKGKINEIINYNSQKYIISLHCSSVEGGNKWCVARKITDFSPNDTHNNKNSKILKFNGAKYLVSDNDAITFKPMKEGCQTLLF